MENPDNKHYSLRSLLLPILLGGLFLFSCKENKGHTAPAVYDKDSASLMISYGINTLISDSGVMRYRMVAERWEVNTVRHPSFWYFDKGLFLEQFDETFHVQAFVESDTAWYYDQLRLWELRGNVRIRTVDGTRFASEELYWDQKQRIFYSNLFSRLVTPTNDMQGTRFRSNEPDNNGQLTHYTIDNSKGSFLSKDVQNSQKDSLRNQPDSLKTNLRTPMRPVRGQFQ